MVPQRRSIDRPRYNLNAPDLNMNKVKLQVLKDQQNSHQRPYEDTPLLPNHRRIYNFQIEKINTQEKKQMAYYNSLQSPYNHHSTQDIYLHPIARIGS